MKVKAKKITDFPHHIYSSNAEQRRDMSLGFYEAFQYVMKTAKYSCIKLNLRHKSYQCCKLFWDVIILRFSI
jgi:hypothetical protein